MQRLITCVSIETMGLLSAQPEVDYLYLKPRPKLMEQLRRGGGGMENVRFWEQVGMM